VNSSATNCPGATFLERKPLRPYRLLCLVTGTLNTGGFLPLSFMDTGGAVHWLPPDHGYWRRGYARGCVDAEQLFRLGCSGDRFQLGNDLRGIVVGAEFGSFRCDPVYIM